MALDGAKVLLLVDPGSGFEPIGKQTSLSVENTRNLIEVDGKQDDIDKFVYGKQGGSISLDALYIEDSADRDAQQYLENAVQEANHIVVRRQLDGVTTEEAVVLVESIEESAGDDEAATLSVDMTLNSKWQTV